MTASFIDIHSHVLHAFDDGARSLDVSLEMLQIAIQSGTTEIVLTPHASSAFPYRAQLFSERLKELRSAAPAGIKIHQGCEFNLSAGNVRAALEDATPFTINGGKYLLVELPEFCVYTAMHGIFEEFLARDIVPIIAHPERDARIQEQPAALEHWIEIGCLVQVTAQSITGHFGRPVKRLTEKLLRGGLVHFVASDAHNCLHRPPRLDLAYRLVSDNFGRDTAELIFKTNPISAVGGQTALLPEPVGKCGWNWLRRLL